jgi:peptidyl-prolyl cis-trans isomerase C
VTVNIWRISAAALAMASWSNCQAATPQGQVVAAVNGEEILLQDVDAQLADMNLPATADRKAARIALIQQIVNRKIMAQEARKLGFDRDPGFIAQRRRAEEELLLSTFARRKLEDVPAPDGTAITQFMTENPHMFAQRKTYRIDQIQFDMPADPATLKSLQSTHSLDEVARALTGMGLKFQRGSGTMDSARIPARQLEQILRLPKGEPFILPGSQAGKGLANVITGSEPLSAPQAEQRDMAAKAIRNQALAKIGEQQLNDARARAQIEYQPGFQPQPR